MGCGRIELHLNRHPREADSPITLSIDGAFPLNHPFLPYLLTPIAIMSLEATMIVFVHLYCLFEARQLC